MKTKGTAISLYRLPGAGQENYPLSVLTEFETGAAFSPDKVYRYLLWRNWDASLPKLCVVGLNPSTADQSEDDPTIRRVKSFAERDSFGGVLMVNLFAYRTTYRPTLMLQPAPVGADNNRWIRMAVEQSAEVLCAWGADGGYMRRDREVYQLLLQFSGKPVTCFGRTKAGFPKHPLYLKKDTPRVPYRCDD